MKICLGLTVIMFIVVFHIHYVDTIKCFVCNSMQTTECLSGSLKPSLIKDCNEVSATKYDQWKSVMRNYNSSYLECPYVKAYESGTVASQCTKITMTLDGKERVVRDCSGVVCREHSAKGMCIRISSSVKSDQCYCESEACNSSHRRLHPTNFWLNIVLPVIICLINLLFNKFI